MTSFPEGFLWGAATAGHQVEGGNVNADIWPLEWATGSRFAEPSGDACDHYHRYPEDIATLAGLGLNSYRFSLEWSRIEPERGWFSVAALDHYRRVIETCLAHDVTPFVTYSHFTTPRWFAAQGGWASADAAELFARYAERATRHLGDLLRWVATLNEPNLMALMEGVGTIPVGARPVLPPVSEEPTELGIGGHDPARYRMGLIGADVEQMASIHRSARDAIRSVSSGVRVGWTLALVDLQAAPGGEDRCERARRTGLLDWLDVSRDDDFVGVQTYARELIGPDGHVPPADGVPVTLTGWEVYPASLGHTVRLAADRAQVPVIVTENGIATDDDTARIAYTDEALQGLAGCVADGIEVRGYLHWSLLDNFEWMSGYRPTFGLISVDRSTMVRTVKPSARWLGEVARRNSI